MLPWDPSGLKGPRDPLPDVVRVLEPKSDVIIDKVSHVQTEVEIQGDTPQDQKI